MKKILIPVQTGEMMLNEKFITNSFRTLLPAVFMRPATPGANA